MARGDLTDEEWFLIEPRLPLDERGPTPDLRQQFNAMMWRFRTGSPRRPTRLVAMAARLRSRQRSGTYPCLHG